MPQDMKPFNQPAEDAEAAAGSSRQELGNGRLAGVRIRTVNQTNRLQHRRADCGRNSQNAVEGILQLSSHTFASN